MTIAAISGRIFGREKVAARKEPAAHGDFRKLVGGGGWHSLPQIVQCRFEALAANPGTTTYAGNMVVKRSPLGWFFAQLCRLLGNPLVPLQGDNVPVDVPFDVPADVFEDHQQDLSPDVRKRARFIIEEQARAHREGIGQ